MPAEFEHGSQTTNHDRLRHGAKASVGSADKVTWS